MSKKVIIGAGQMGPSDLSNGKVDKKGNVLRVLALLEKAIKEKVKIICFPELCLTSYFAVRTEWDYEHYFDQIPNDLTKDIFTITREHPISVLLPYGEFDGTTYYNTVGFIQQGELIEKYRKIHIPGAFANRERAAQGVSNFEKQYFTPGNLGYRVFDVHGVKVGVQICYDRFFPEGYRSLALLGTHVVFTPTALPSLGIHWRKVSWEPLLRLRSFENNMFVVGINKGGVENGLDFDGDSMIIEPIGASVIARAQSKGDELITAEIDPDDTIEAKKSLPIFRDRRPLEYVMQTD